MKAWQIDMLMPEKPPALAIAEQRYYVDSPQLVNEALVWALAMQREGVTDDVRLAYIIKNLTEASIAQDALKVEQEGV